LAQLQQKFFVMDWKVPLIAVNSLESMIEPFLGQNYDVIIPLIDAKECRFIAPFFDGNSGEMLTETEAKILDEQSFKELEGKKILFVGDEPKKRKDFTKFRVQILLKMCIHLRNILIKKSVEKFNRQDFEDVAYFEPFI
jgi:tRNA threonylcarbamoyladenosine biosynthesis protein TsaB